MASAIMMDLSIGYTQAQTRAPLSNVPAANPATAGFIAPNILSQELEQIVWANGATKLENPTALIGFYGYNNDGLHMAIPGAVQVSGGTIEASKVAACRIAKRSLGMRLSCLMWRSSE